MKRKLLPLLFISLVVSSIMAQRVVDGFRTVGGQMPKYDPKTPPPLPLSDAYALAVQHIAPFTNRFYCISANCTEMTNQGFAGWTFTFTKTNGVRGNVQVYFDKVVTSDFTRKWGFGE